MAVYIITYDLQNQGYNYIQLVAAIKKYPHWHMQASIWIISTDQTTDQIFETLSPAIDANDELLISRLSSCAILAGYSKQLPPWLSKAAAQLPCGQ